jgi:serine/threonine-protein kinase
VPTRPPSPPVPLDEPITFGRYRVSAVIHHGKTGVVYEGSFAGSNKRVAIKALDAQVGNDLVLRERFIRGARATSLVRSPHLATIYEVGVQMPSGHVWCAMELIEGRSLAVEEIEEPLPPGRALHIARQLAEALTAVHAGGVIHRNIKPANVMLTTRGGDEHYVRLVGFGLVKLANTRELTDELTARGAVVGTPAYMAPEALVDSSQVDLTCDIYSLGVVLYEMLTGRLPYGSSSRSVIEQLKAKQAGPPPLGIEPVIDELLGRMLSPDLAHRPRTMEEVQQGLALTLLNEDLDGVTTRDLAPATPQFRPIDLNEDSDFVEPESKDPTAPGKRRR